MPMSMIYVPASMIYVPVSTIFVPASMIFVPVSTIFVPASMIFVPMSTIFVPVRMYFCASQYDVLCDRGFQPTSGIHPGTLTGGFSLRSAAAKLRHEDSRRHRRLKPPVYVPG